MSDWNPAANSLFAQAVEIESADRRQAFIDEACGGDTMLRARVERLLKAHNDAGSFLEQPALGLTATIARGDSDTVDESRGDISLDFLTPSDKPNCLGTLGQYEVIEAVGRGGMGIVLRAYDTKLNRVVAIKLMAPELAANAMAVKRFLREARAAAAVSHEQVVTIHAIEESNRPPYIVMEFIDGQSLQEKIDRAGGLALEEILRIGMQMARGLAAAHEQGLVHRDIKPANILLENGIERVKLTDFGLARAVDDVSVTQTGQIAGTPQFMSPEQAQGHTIDARSDLFSLGSVLYTMCTGRPPFRAESAVAMLRRVTDDEPRPIREASPDMPDWLEAIVFKLLAKDPAERFQSAEDVAGLFSQHLAYLQRPTTAPKPARVAPPIRSSQSDQRPTKETANETARTQKMLGPVLTVGLAVAVCLMLAAVAGVVIFLRSNFGTIRIEVNDPNTTVTIDNQMVVTLKDPTAGSLKVRPGEHKLHIQQNDLEFETDSFRIKRGEEVVLSVEMIGGNLGARLQRPESRRVEGGSATTHDDLVIGMQRAASPDASPPFQLTEVRRFDGHVAPVTELVVLPSGRQFVSASVGKGTSIRLWNLATGALLAKTEPGTSAAHLAISPDGTRLVSGHPDGSVVVWGITSNAIAKERELPSHDSVSDAIWTADGRHLVTFCSHPGRDSYEPARVYDTESWKRRRELDCGADMFSAAAHPDGKHVLFGLSDQRGLSYWNVESGENVREMPIACNQIKGLAIDANGEFALSGDNSGYVQLRNLATGKLVKKFVGHGDNKRMSPVHAVEFLPDGRHIVSGGWDKTLRAWSLDTGQEIARATAARQTMQVMTALPDGKHVLSGGGMEKTDARIYSSDGDHAIRLWRLPESVWSKERATELLELKLRLIPAGEFEMGTADKDVGVLPADDAWFFADFVPNRRKAETPRHRVSISKPFEMSEREVTVRQFRRFVEATGYKTTAEQEGEGYGWRNGEWQEGSSFTWRNPGFEQTDDHPVCNVSWEDATEFCRWLSEKEGGKYRLPTEAEWEYACRAGTMTLFSTGDDVDSLRGAANLADATLRKEQPGAAWAVGWDDGFAATAPVGSFKPNAFGLYDMHGNVWEWCQDVYDEEWYETSPATDPLRSGSGRHVFRGGGFDNWPGFLRSADRYSSHSETIFTDWAGFRVVREFAVPEPREQNGNLPVEWPASGTQGSDMNFIQGTWNCLSAIASGTELPTEQSGGKSWTFTGETFFEPAQQRPRRGKFVLDTATDPKQIDLHIPAEQDGFVVIRGIYELKGDRLTICVQEDFTAAKRPTDFTTVPGDKRSLLVFERVMGRELLQGTWQVVALEGAGQTAPKNSFGERRFLFEGDRLSLTGMPEDLHPFRLNATSTPKQIDIGSSVEGQFSKAIYELEGDTLRLCLSQQTRLDRPKDFDTEGTRYFCFTLKRVEQ